MTREDYAKRLGLSVKAVGNLLRRLRAKLKPLPRQRRSESLRYTPDTNWLVLAEFIRTTKRPEAWKVSFRFALIDYYRKRGSIEPLQQSAKAFHGLRFPKERRAEIVNHLAPPEAPASPAPANPESDPFRLALSGSL